MNHTWEEVYERINSIELTSMQWESDKRNIIKMFEYAQQRNLDPELFIKPSFSILRETSRIAKRAIANRNPQKFQEIVEMAGSMTIADFRLKNETVQPDKIPTSTIIEDGQEYILASFLPEQFDAMKKRERLHFAFYSTDEN